MRPHGYDSLVSLAALALLAIGASPAAAWAESIRFNRDVRPILAENCFACHGPDKAKRKAKLRLDTRDGLFGEREGHRPVQPGKPQESDLFRRITTENQDDHMPPTTTGKQLRPRQVQVLKQWIEQGASWEGHWAFAPPTRAELPAVHDAKRSSNPLDRFILARLTREGLRPSPEADRRTLIRRLSFDLTGLPPRSEEVDAFVRDGRPDAYERLVGTLLASPHFGERLAMHWLDVVRYADTDGFHADNFRSVYPYRDYVIQAFNENLPFDRFTREQLAGDLLPNATRAQRIASTYNRLGRSTEEGGSQPKEYLAKYAAERVRATAATWLGATFGCAECHDHKYDPYTTRDFYRFEAFFADLKEQGVGVREASLTPTPAQQEELEVLDKTLQALGRQLKTPTPDLAKAQARWEERLQARLAAQQLGWTPVRPDEVASRGGATMTTLEDLSVLASGENPTNDVYTVTLRTARTNLTALRLEVLTHATHDKQSLSRGGGGNIILTSFEVAALQPGATNSTPVPLASATADFSQDGWPVAAAIDDKPETGWAVAGHEKSQSHQAAFSFAQPLAGGPGTVLTVRLKHLSSYKQHNIGRFRLALIDLERPTLDEFGLPKTIVETLRKPSAGRNAEEQEALTKHFLEITPALDATRAELATTTKRREQFVKQIPTTLMAVSVEPRVMRVLPRGNWMNDSGEIVTPAPPAFLWRAAEAARPLTRLDLARWVVAPENPLTARVFVNRLWRLFFGVGISKSLDDLGLQGESPVHPELLDWLAVEFREHGWDVKHIVRLMVTSRTYRQTARVSDRLRERDAENRLLARQSEFRLGAEQVRDNLLAISGLLVETIGGPSVKPYQPAGYWDQLNFPKRTWEHDHGEALYRRGLYTLWCRTFLHPSLLAFDACPREESTPERAVSNTPLQALTLLNDPTYVEAARAFAERTLRQGGAGVASRLEWAFNQTLNRRPTGPERRVMAGLLRDQLALYRGTPEAARDLLKVGERRAAEDLNAPELAAWTAVARTLFNLHETINRP